MHPILHTVVVFSRTKVGNPVADRYKWRIGHENVRHFRGQNKADLYNYLPRGVDNCKNFKIHFNSYKISDTVFYTTILSILNNSETEVVD